MEAYRRDGKVLIGFIAETAGLVEGSFRFNDVLQIRPLPEDAPKPARSIGTTDQHPFIIEYSFDDMDIEALREVRTEGPSSSSYIPEDNHLNAECRKSGLVRAIQYIPCRPHMLCKLVNPCTISSGGCEW